MNSKVMRAAFGVAIQRGITSMYAQAPVTGAGGPVTAVPAPPRANATKVETEVIEINDFSAFPSEITRKAGKFFLLLVNKTRNKQTGLVFDAPSALFNSNPPPYETVAQNVNGTGTLLRQGTIGSGGVISGAPCSIDLTNSKVHVNPNAALSDPDPNASLVTDIYLDLSATVAHHNAPGEYLRDFDRPGWPRQFDAAARNSMARRSGGPRGLLPPGVPHAAGGRLIVIENGH